VTVSLIDTHAHLNDPRLLPRVGEVLARAAVAGVSEVVVPGYDLASSARAVALSEAHPEVWAAVGMHPHEASHLDEAARRRLRALAAHPRVVAIGETGLDFYRDRSPRDLQRTALQWHVELAQELSLPVVCHCREAEEALLELLSRWPGVRRVWHCFDGTAGQAQQAAAHGLWVSFGGMVTYPDSGWRHEAVAATPQNRMLLETDAPYLAPYPKEGKRPRDNEPAYLTRVAERVAEIRGEALAVVAAAATANARRVFGLGGE
jgi:TatD DNase family protein